MATPPAERVPEPASQNEYFVEKRRFPVELEFATGERCGGHLFIQASWRGPSVQEDIPEYLNSADPFFPLELADGSTRLVARHHVALLRTSAPDPDRDDARLGEPTPVRVAMRTGTQVDGIVYIEVRPPYLRLLDHLNGLSDPFITLHNASGDVIVNRAHVLYVTEAGTA